MPEPIITGDNWPWLYKKQNNCPKLKSFVQLILCHNHPLGISTLKALKPTKSFSSLSCPQRMRDISFNKPRRMTNDFDYSKVKNATTLDAENSADYIY